MKMSCLAATWLACVALAGPASAVSMSHDGTGQVLIFPYYTVHGNRVSEISLSNHTDQAKAVKLVIRGGATGAPVFVLNIYLSGHDTWTGSLFSWDDGTSTAPALLSNDNSCTVPDLKADTLPTVPDGRHYLRPNASGGVAGYAVPGEGYVVAIEMGELHGASAEALTPGGRTNAYDRSTADCGRLVAAWQQDGYWHANPATDLTPPDGGLSGEMMVIDVGDGAVFKAAATALNDFRVTAMHTAPTEAVPDLGDAQSDASTGIATALLRIGDKLVRSDYPADRAVDAVSAVLMTNELDGEFDFRRSIDAHTDFVMTMPTKRFYVADRGAIVPPFGRDEYHQRSPLGTLCPLIFINAYDRSGSSTDSSIYSHAGASLDRPEEAVPKPCYATSVFALDSTTRPRSLFDSELSPVPPFSEYYVQAGSVSFSMNAYNPRCYSSTDCLRGHDYVRAHLNLMRPDLQGRIYFGLPVVGFAATGFVNDHAGGQGILGNYTYAAPYRRGPAICAQDGVVGACSSN